MKLSAPKPIRETLPVAIPAPIATTPSTAFHATVNTSRRTPRWWSSSLRAAVAAADKPSARPCGRAAGR